MDPPTAASAVQDLLNLSTGEREILLAELMLTAEEPILALKINPAWMAQNGEGAETAVLHEIAHFELSKGKRDEHNPGFLYYFNTSFELDKCKASVFGNHQSAFAPSPATLAHIGAGAAALVPFSDREPLAFTALIHKVAVRQDDVQHFQFFYT
jgi:hypothetical protein